MQNGLSRKAKQCEPGWPVKLEFLRSSRQTERVITLTEPQVWAALAILLAFLTATLTITTRTISVQIGSLRNEMNAKFETSSSEIRSLKSEMNLRIDGLDRDVQALTNKVFGDGRPN
jgi:hypothetical protein